MIKNIEVTKPKNIQGVIKKINMLINIERINIKIDKEINQKID